MDLAAAELLLEHAELVDIVRRNLEHVAVDGNEIRIFADFERAWRFFLMSGVRRVKRKAAERPP